MMSFRVSITKQCTSFVTRYTLFLGDADLLEPPVEIFLHRSFEKRFIIKFE